MYSGAQNFYFFFDYSTYQYYNMSEQKREHKT